jgi:hypothetical protein
MNKTFDIKRFGKYFAYDIKSIWKENSIFLLVWCLLPVFIYLVYMFFSFVGGGLQTFISGELSRPPIALRGGLFATAAILFIMVFPSKAFGFITEKAKGSSWLMLPASRFEKYLSMMLISLVLVPLAFFLTYLLSDALVCLVDGKCGGSIFSSWSIINNIDPSEEDIKLGGNGLWFIVSWVLQTSSIFLLGALLFKKSKVLKTILSLFVISMLLSIIMVTVVKVFHIDFPDMGIRFVEWAKKHADNMDYWFNFWANVELAFIVIGCGLWSWFRVKKIQH